MDPNQYYDAIDKSKRCYTSVPSQKIIWEVIERGLVTKINERPYISFIDPLKTGEEE